jgi:hypothetical protein
MLYILIIILLYIFNIHSHLITHCPHSSRFGAKRDTTQWSFISSCYISSLYFTCSSFTFISQCQRRRSLVVFLFMVPKGMQPNGLSLLHAKGDATQWSFTSHCQRDAVQWSFRSHCQRGYSSMVFRFTLPKGTQPSGLPFYFLSFIFTFSLFISHCQRGSSPMVFHISFFLTYASHLILNSHVLKLYSTYHSS